MSVVIGESTSIAGQSSSGAEMLGVALAKSQQEQEGKMALALLQSASIKNIPAPSGNSGFNINIKV